MYILYLVMYCYCHVHGFVTGQYIMQVQYLQWWVMFLWGLIKQLEDRIHFIDFLFLLASEG